MISKLRHIPAALLLALPAGLWAQAWTGSGSNGTDGALNITLATAGVVGGVLIFDPVALNLDLNADNVYHFTTITISDGITVLLQPQKLRRNGPVVWLATGAVLLNGSLNLSGAIGHPGGVDYSLRMPARPGPGGYPGGVGGRQSAIATQGFGPGGGLPPVGVAANYGCNAGHTGDGTSNSANTSCAGKFGIAYGSAFLQPLLGGSGGSGANCSTVGEFGGGGGAGGGAIRISTDGAYSSNNWMYATGGSGGVGCLSGGGGSGGSVHIQAAGGIGIVYVNANGGNDAYGQPASSGRVRFDTPTGTFGGGSVTPAPILGPLVNVPLPINPTVKVTTVDGVAVPALPQGLYTVPDVSMNKTTPVTLNLAATNVPVGTQMTLIITTEGTANVDQVVTATALAGTLANSTATASVTFPQGVIRFFARAVW